MYIKLIEKLQEDLFKSISKEDIARRNKVTNRGPILNALRHLGLTKSSQEVQPARYAYWFLTNGVRMSDIYKALKQIDPTVELFRGELRALGYDACLQDEVGEEGDTGLFIGFFRHNSAGDDLKNYGIE